MPMLTVVLLTHGTMCDARQKMSASMATTLAPLNLKYASILTKVLSVDADPVIKPVRVGVNPFALWVSM